MSDSVNPLSPLDAPAASSPADDIERRVLTCVATTMHFELSRVTPEATFEALGLDSLDGINVLFALENEFDISIPDDAAKQVRDIRGLVEGVRGLVSQKGTAA